MPTSSYPSSYSATYSGDEAFGPPGLQFFTVNVIVVDNYVAPPPGSTGIYLALYTANYT